MTIFVISDTHLGHANIIKYCPWRPSWATDIESHDRALIEAWRAVVKPDDQVIHMGDVALGNKETVANYRKALTGHITVVLGNHDRTAKSMQDIGFDVVTKRHRLDIDGYGTVICRHDPKLFTPDDLPARTLLHGHWHGDINRHGGLALVPPACHPFLVDCGIDALKSIAPVPLLSVLL